MAATKTIKKVTCPRCNGSGEIEKIEGIVSITEQHAYSLSKMVKWFKKLILEAKMPATEERSDELTAEYCDELLDDLNEEGVSR